jgi:hypothetical protein
MSTLLRKLLRVNFVLGMESIVVLCRTMTSLITPLAIAEVIENSSGSHYHKFRMSTLHPITLVVQAAVTNRNWHEHHNPSYKLLQHLVCQRTTILQGRGYCIGSNIRCTISEVLIYQADLKLEVTPHILTVASSVLQVLSRSSH